MLDQALKVFYGSTLLFVLVYIYRYVQKAKQDKINLLQRELRDAFDETDAKVDATSIDELIKRSNCRHDK